MVEFTNLRTDKNWIYADAYDADFKTSGKIKLSKHKSEVFIDYEKDDFNDIKKACWNLQDEFENNKNKLPNTEKIVIMWG